MKLLTKSKYISGLQCHKLLWFLVNAKDQLPALDESTLQRMDEGTKVGELATKLFPNGINIPSNNCVIKKWININKKLLN